MKEKELSFDDVYVSLSASDRYKGSIEPEKLMQKSVINSGFHTEKKLPCEMYNTKSLKKQLKKIKPQLSEEVRRDIKVIKMRAAMDPKRFYKRNLIKGNMENVQVGTVMDSPADFHNSLPNKSRKSTLVDELLADAKFKKNIKRRYVQIIEKKKFKYKKEYKQYSKRKSK